MDNWHTKNCADPKWVFIITLQKIVLPENCITLQSGSFEQPLSAPQHSIWWICTMHILHALVGVQCELYFLVALQKQKIRVLNLNDWSKFGDPSTNSCRKAQRMTFLKKKNVFQNVSRKIFVFEPCLKLPIGFVRKR
jgi:hypothetical protein